MFAGGMERRRIGPNAPTASAVAALFADERLRDARGVALPRAEIHIVARFGPSVPGGADVHAMGGRERVSAPALAGRIVAATSPPRPAITINRTFIADFRAIAGVTPQALLGELADAHSVG